MELNFSDDIKKWLDKLEPLKPESTGLNPKLKCDVNNHTEIKAVIFDIYGTLLVSSSGDIDQASLTVENMTKALKAGGFGNDNNRELISSFLLEKLPVKIKSNQDEVRQMGHPFPDIDIFKVWREMLNEAKNEGLVTLSGEETFVNTIFVFEILSNKVFPMPGMKEILDDLTQKNVLLGIVSNAQFYTPILMNFFLSGNFSTNQDIEYFQNDLSVFSYKEMRGKPDVELFKKFIPVLKEKYHVNPSETLFVGNDMLKDIYTAQKAGIKTALFAGDKRSLRLRKEDDRVKGVFPDFIVTELKQITEIIK